MEPAEASGFFVTDDGLLVTAAHVINGTVPLGVTLPDGTDAVVSELVAEDPDADLALRIGGSGFPVLPLAEVLPQPGASLLAVTKDGAAAVTYLGPCVSAAVGGDAILFSAEGLNRGARISNT